MNPLFDLIVIGVIFGMVFVNLWSVRESQNTLSPWTKLKEKIHDISPWGPSPTLSSPQGEIRLTQD